MDAEVIRAIGSHIITPLVGLGVFALFIWLLKD